MATAVGASDLSDDMVDRIVRATERQVGYCEIHGTSVREIVTLALANALLMVATSTPNGGTK